MTPQYTMPCSSERTASHKLMHFLHYVFRDYSTSYSNVYKLYYTFLQLATQTSEPLRHTVQRYMPPPHGQLTDGR